jgi:phosphotransferase system  glucose/maltose/N-acetylglucosamine-specific IIC component
MQVFRLTWDKVGIARELLGFLWRSKMWWLMPIVAVLLLAGILIGFGSASGVGPFIYTLF